MCCKMAPRPPLEARENFGWGVEKIVHFRHFFGHFGAFLTLQQENVHFHVSQPEPARPAGQFVVTLSHQLTTTAPIFYDYY